MCEIPDTGIKRMQSVAKYMLHNANKYNLPSDKMYEIPNNRIRHMQGVAEYMLHNANKYNLSPDKMYVLGLLHDIGYLYGKGEHEVTGSWLLKRIGFSYSDIVSWHGTAPQDFLRLRDLEEAPPELVLLWEADMSVDPNGEEVGFDARLKDIGERLGCDSVAYHIANETVEWLRNRK